MLVVSRKKSERIIIGGGLVVITIVEVRGDKVRIGIDAPEEIRIDREEVHLAIQRKKERRQKEDSQPC